MRARWGLVAVVMVLVAAMVGANALAGGGGGIKKVRWDIVSIDFENGEVNEGGPRLGSGE
ncbi:MAG: hypothetical protein ACRDKB_08980 [Actinomycetota bacterium]